MRVGRPPYGLAELLKGSLSTLDLESRVKEESLLLVWDEVVGEQVAAATRPEFVKDGRMFVTTKSAVWVNELGFYKADIISRLNERAGARVLRDIIFKVGRLRRRSGAKRPRAPSDDDRLEGIRLSDAELEQVESAVRNSPPELADRARDLVTAALRLDKWKRARGWVPCGRCGALQSDPSGVCPPCQIEEKRIG